MCRGDSDGVLRLSDDANPFRDGFQIESTYLKRIRGIEITCKDQVVKNLDPIYKSTIEMKGLEMINFSRTRFHEECNLIQPFLSTFDVRLVSLNLSSCSLVDASLKSHDRVRFFNLLELNLSRNRLSRIPEFVSSIRTPKLEIFSIAYNQIRALGNSIPTSTLKDLDVSNNRLDLTERVLRDTICVPCFKLTSINLENNSISNIPCEFSLMTSLRAFLISGNLQRTIRPSTVAKGTAAVMSFLERKVTAEARERFQVEREEREKMRIELISRDSVPSNIEFVDTKVVASSKDPVVDQEEMNRTRGELDLAMKELEKWKSLVENGVDEKGRTLTSAKRFALKKLLARARAKCIRLERKLK